MDRTLFGIFHTAYERSGDYFFRAADSDDLNVFIVESDYKSEQFAVTMNELKKHKDKCAFVAVSGLGFSVRNNTSVADTGEEQSAFRPEATFLSDYRARADEMIAYLKDHGWYESVVGFYMDEPLLWNIKREWLKEFTKYFRTKAAPEKGFSCAFPWRELRPNTGRLTTCSRSHPIAPNILRMWRSTCIINGTTIIPRFCD